MTRIALIGAAALIAALATPAHAVAPSLTQNGTSINGLELNGSKLNGMGTQGLQPNGTSTSVTGGVSLLAIELAPQAR